MQKKKQTVFTFYAVFKVIWILIVTLENWNSDRWRGLKKKGSVDKFGREEFLLVSGLFDVYIFMDLRLWTNLIMGMACTGENFDDLKKKKSLYIRIKTFRIISTSVISGDILWQIIWRRSTVLMRRQIYILQNLFTKPDLLFRQLQQ